MINEFRIYRIDNKKLDKTRTEKNILSIIKQWLWTEFKSIDEKDLIFKNLSNDIKYFTFAWVITDDKHEWPNRYNFLNLLWEKELFEEMKKSYIQVRTSILTIFKLSWNYFIVTYWNAFHSLPSELIDDEFWITLWKKLITDKWKIKSIYQSVITWDLESTYKSLKNNNKYNPMSDLTNLWKLTKWLNGLVNSKEIFHDIEELQTLHLWLDWNKWLKFNTQTIDKEIFKKVLKKINDIYNLDSPNSLKIPDLKKIKFKDKTYLKLIDTITNSINSWENNVYFSPDRFKEYIMHNPWSWDTIKKFKLYDNWNELEYDYDEYWMIDYVDIVKFIQDNNFTISNVSQLSINWIKIEDSNWDERWIKKYPKLLNCLIGELVYKWELYLFEWETFYKPNTDFKSIVTSTFDEKLEKLTITDDDFLHNWDINNSITIWHHEEDKFNRAHDKRLESHIWIDNIFCLDRWVDRTNQYKWIEICDLIKKDNNLHYFIHVKKVAWADTRILFSQWRVWFSIMLDESKDVSKHLRDKTWLNSITKKMLDDKNFSIVYAIKKKESNIFTLYAKYDFINTLEFFHNKWIDDIKFYEIK